MSNDTDSTNTGRGRAEDHWVSAEEPMTSPQRSHLHTLAREAGIDVPSRLTKAQASRLIDELQQEAGRAGP